MSVAPESPKPSRTPWIIAGVLGCLVICLIVAVLGVGGFALFGQSGPRTVPTIAAQTLPTIPSVVVPTVPSITVVVPTVPSITVVVPPVPPVTQPVQPVTQPVQSGAQPAQPGTQPTLELVAPATQQPAASPTATKPVAPSGRIAFSKCDGNCDSDDKKTVWVMNADGSNAKKILDRASEPTWSPDGTKIAYYHWKDGIFVANADGTAPKKVLGEGNAGFLSWSHDGRWIAFTVRPGGAGNIATDAIAPDGTGRHPVVVGWSPSWSPDDVQLVFQTCRGSACGIFKGPSAGGDATPIVTDDGGLPSFSPDGNKIIYQKDIDGQKQLFLINADGSGKKQLTSGAALHVSANWSPDGSFIFYRSPEGGQWGIWRMAPDGSNQVKLANDMAPGDWPYDRIAVTK